MPAHFDIQILPLLIWQVLVAVALLLQWASDEPGIVALLNVFNLGFGAGMVSALACRRNWIAKPFTLVVFGTLGIAVTIGAEIYAGRNLPHIDPAIGVIASPLIYIFWASLLVTGLAASELRMAPKKSAVAKIAAILGGATYLLYLVHGMVMSVLIRVLRDMWPTFHLPTIVLLLPSSHRCGSHSYFMLAM